jgi:hypothetical protein
MSFSSLKLKWSCCGTNASGLRHCGCCRIVRCCSAPRLLNRTNAFADDNTSLLSKSFVNAFEQSSLVDGCGDDGKDQRHS